MKTTSSKIKLTFLLALIAAAICCVLIAFAGIFGVKETVASADEITETETAEISEEATPDAEDYEVPPTDNASVTICGKTYTYYSSYTLNGTTCTAQASIWRNIVAASHYRWTNSSGGSQCTQRTIYVKMTQDWIAASVSGTVTTGKNSGLQRTSFTGNFDNTGVAGNKGFHKGSIAIFDVDIILDLNGHTISRNLTDTPGAYYGSVFYMANGSHDTKLTIVDSSSSGAGKITGGYRYGGAGGAIYMDHGSTLVLDGGNIIGNRGEEGAGVCLAYYSTFIMNGGSIVDNFSEDNNSGGGVWVGAGSTFTMNGGIIANNFSTSGIGCGVCVKSVYWDRQNTGYGTATFNMNGGTISGNYGAYYAFGQRPGFDALNPSAYMYDAQGAGVYVGTASVFNLKGGSIVGNKGEYGGGVYSVGAFTMTGGIISNNACSGRGGGVYSVGAFTMNGGTIANNVAQEQGGGIFGASTVTINGGSIVGNRLRDDDDGAGVYSTGAFTMTAGTISKNVGGDDGGGVYCESTVTIKGGSISDNYSMYAGGVFCDGTFTMTGGSISNNSSDTGYAAGVYCNSNVIISGGSICNNIGDEDTYGGVYARTTFTMSGGTISNNTGNTGGVYAKGAVKISGGTISGNTGYRYAGGVYCESTVTVEGGEISYNVGADKGAGIYSNSTFTMSGGTISYNTSNITASISDSGIGGGVMVMNGNATISGGNIVSNTAKTYGGGVYVNNGITVSGSANISNNKAITGGGISMYFDSATVTVNGGTISGNTANDGHGGGIYTRGYVTVNGGAITGNRSYNDDDAGMGGGVYSVKAFKITGGDVSNNTTQQYGAGICCASTVTIQGGSISNNTVNDDGYGGGVYAGGAFTMSGGSVANNDGHDGGGGVYGASTVTISGGTISGNQSDDAAGVYAQGEFTISGTATISNNSATDKGAGVYAQSTVKINGGAIIGNSSSSYCGGVYAKGAVTMTAGDVSNNINENHKGGGIYSEQSVTVSGGTICGNNSEYGGGGIYAGANVTISGSANISNNTANYDGGGGVYAVGTVTISGGTISGNRAIGDEGGGVYSGGSFTISGGVISGNQSNMSGGGVTMASTTGTCTISGGVISNNTCSAQGGGVTSYGTFKMTGGTFSGNTASSGGGIYGTKNVTIEGGAIFGNSGTTGGGVESLGAFTLSGTATIANNTANSDGGGVYAVGTVEITGGMISGNEVTYTGTYNYGNGGGVYANGNVTMTNGTIADNTTTRSGGGIYATYGKTVTLSGGKITGNKVIGMLQSGTSGTTWRDHHGAGAGVCCWALNSGSTATGGIVNVSGAIISDNTSIGASGGIAAYTVNITSGTISGNRAENYNGGGVACQNFTMSGGTIANNFAGSHAGGVMVDYDATVNITGGEFLGNYSGWDSGQGLYARNCTAVTIKNCNFTGNGSAGSAKKTAAVRIENEDKDIASITVSGCNFTDNNAGLIISEDLSSNEVSRERIKKVEISNNNFSGNKYYGLSLLGIVEAKLSGNTYSNNTITTISGYYVSYAYYSGLALQDVKTATITGETIVGNMCQGLHLDDVVSATIENCTVKGNGYSNYYGDGVYLTKKYVAASNIVIKNCDISSNKWDGISAHNVDFTLDHCTISGNGSEGVWFTGVNNTADDRTAHSVTIIGGAITGNAFGLFIDFEYALNLSGAVNISNNFSTDNNGVRYYCDIQFDWGPQDVTNKIRVVGSLEENGKKACIGLSRISNNDENEPYTDYTVGFGTNNPGKSPSEYFYSTTTGYNPYLVNGEVQMLQKAPELNWEYSTDNGASYQTYDGTDYIQKGAYTGTAWAVRAYYTAGEYKTVAYYQYGKISTVQGNVKEAGMYLARVTDASTEWSNGEFILVIEGGSSGGDPSPEATLTGISVSFDQTKAVKTTDALNSEELSKYGTLTVKETYSDGTAKAVTSGYTLTFPTGDLKAGANAIGVAYTSGEKSYSATFNVFVVEEQKTEEPELTGISVNFAQSANISITLENLDDITKSGTLIIKETYSNGTLKTVTAGYKLALKEKELVAGANTVNVTYTVGEGEDAETYTASFTIFVVDDRVVTPVLTGISVSFKQTANINNNVNVSTLGDYGTLIVKEVYDDKSEKVITAGYTLSAGTLVAGANTVTVTYTVGEGEDVKTYTDTFEIFVNAKFVTGIKVTYTPDGNKIYLDAELTSIGTLVVVANYSDGSAPVTLTAGNYTLSVSGGKLVLGSNTIVVTYKTNAGEFKDAFDVTVVARDATVKSLEVTSTQNDFIYSSTKLEDLASKLTLTVNAVNGDGDRNALSASEYQITNFNAATGEVTVTLKSNTEITAKFNVVVTAKAVTGITVDYTQTEVEVIYPDYNIQSLKPRMTVKVNYNDGSAAVTLADGDYTLAGNLAVGTSPLVVSYTDGAGKVHTATFNVNVTAKPDGAKTQTDIVWGDELTFVFDGKEHKPVAYYYIDGAKYAVSLEVTVSGSTLTDGKAIKVGTYRATVDKTQVKEGYELRGDDFKDFKITEATIEIKWTNTGSGEFDGSEHMPTVEATSTVNDETVKFSVVIEPKAGSAVTVDGKAVSAGEYIARLVITDGGNYKVVGELEYGFSITKAQVNKTPESNVDGSKKFDSLADAIEYVKAQYGDAKVTVNGVENENGGYDITVTVADESNYDWNDGTLEAVKFSFAHSDPVVPEKGLSMPWVIAICVVLGAAAVVALTAVIIVMAKRRRRADEGGFYDMYSE